MKNIIKETYSKGISRYLPLMGTALVSVLILMLVSCGAERSFKKGEKFLALGEYFDAAAQYKKAYSNTKPKDKALRGKYAAKMALCYNRINFNQKAVAAYRNAIRYHADSIDMHLAFAKA